MSQGNLDECIAAHERAEKAVVDAKRALAGAKGAFGPNGEKTKAADKALKDAETARSATGEAVEASANAFPDRLKAQRKLEVAAQHQYGRGVTTSLFAVARKMAQKATDERRADWGSGWLAPEQRGAVPPQFQKKPAAAPAAAPAPVAATPAPAPAAQAAPAPAPAAVPTKPPVAAKPEPKPAPPKIDISEDNGDADDNVPQGAAAADAAPKKKTSNPENDSPDDGDENLRAALAEADWKGQSFMKAKDKAKEARAHVKRLDMCGAERAAMDKAEAAACQKEETAEAYRLDHEAALERAAAALFGCKNKEMAARMVAELRAKSPLMNGLGQLEARAAACEKRSFDESDHPRGSDGKFGAADAKVHDAVEKAHQAGAFTQKTKDAVKAASGHVNLMEDLAGGKMPKNKEEYAKARAEEDKALSAHADALDAHVKALDAAGKAIAAHPDRSAANDIVEKVRMSHDQGRSYGASMLSYYTPGEKGYDPAYGKVRAGRPQKLGTSSEAGVVDSFRAEAAGMKPADEKPGVDPQVAPAPRDKEPVDTSAKPMNPGVDHTTLQ